MTGVQTCALPIFAEGKAEGRAEGKAEGIAEGMEKGMEKGITKGRAQERAEMAKAMLNDGMDIEYVSKISKMSIEELRDL